LQDSLQVILKISICLLILQIKGVELDEDWDIDGWR
jgi:hypothetical protein